MKTADALKKAAKQQPSSRELQNAVFACLDEFHGEHVTVAEYCNAIYWAAYAKAYGMDNDNAALFGVVQITM